MKEQAMMEFSTTAKSDEDGTDETDARVDKDAYLKNAAHRSQMDVLKQRKREVEIALFLRDKIQPYVNGTVDEAEFVALCQAEAATITKGSYGDIFCTAIGYALEVEGADFVGTYTSFMGMDGQSAKMRKRSYSLNNQVKVISSGIGAARAGRQAYKEVDKLQREAKAKAAHSTIKSSEDASATPNATPPIDDKTNEDTPIDQESMKAATEEIEKSLPAILELAWAINVQDITRTLEAVCIKLFHDAAELLPLETRVKRAEAIQILGQEFYAVGKIASTTNMTSVDVKDISTRAQVAAMTTLAKAQGQEVSEKDAEVMIKRAKEMEAEQQKYKSTK
jgi:X-domain of DnaJ-containing